MRIDSNQEKKKKDKNKIMIHQRRNETAVTRLVYQKITINVGAVLFLDLNKRRKWNSCLKAVQNICILFK